MFVKVNEDNVIYLIFWSEWKSWNESRTIKSTLFSSTHTALYIKDKKEYMLGVFLCMLHVDIYIHCLQGKDVMFEWNICICINSSSRKACLMFCWFISIISCLNFVFFILFYLITVSLCTFLFNNSLVLDKTRAWIYFEYIDALTHIHLNIKYWKSNQFSFILIPKLNNTIKKEIPRNQARGTIKTQNTKDKTHTWNKETQMTGQHESLWNT